MDDIFAVFESEENALRFLDFLNKQHASIKFTSESELCGKLPFLDVLMNRNSTCFITSVFRKKTFTGLLMNFDSFVPITYKKGLVRT